MAQALGSTAPGLMHLSVPKLEVEPTYLTDAFRALKSLPITFDVTGAR